jgi:hypothetical protein
MGIQCIVSPHLERFKNDYSQFKSPSRAKRRHRYGKLKKVVPQIDLPQCFQVGNQMFMSQSFYDKIKGAK